MLSCEQCRVIYRPRTETQRFVCLHSTLYYTPFLYELKTSSFVFVYLEHDGSCVIHYLIKLKLQSKYNLSFVVYLLHYNSTHPIFVVVSSPETLDTGQLATLPGSHEVCVTK